MFAKVPAPILKEDFQLIIFNCVALRRKLLKSQRPLMVSTEIPWGSCSARHLTCYNVIASVFSLSNGLKCEIHATTIVTSNATNKRPPGEKEDNFTGEQQKKRPSHLEGKWIQDT